jgi:hypothetical protein
MTTQRTLRRPFDTALGAHVIDDVLPLGLGVRFPIRTTLLAIESGLVVVSPIAIDDALGSAIDALGPVRYLVAPNLLHHLFLGDAVRRWPSARVIAPPGLAAKRKDLGIDAVFEPGRSPWPGEIDVVAMEGAPSIDEHVLVHRASGTLVTTDLVFHVLRASTFSTWITFALIAGTLGRCAQSRLWRFATRDRALAARSARTLLGLDFDRLIPAHGETIAAGAHGTMESALAWMLGGEPRALPRATGAAR